MSIEEYTPDLDSSEIGGTGAESASEKVSEAFKESVKKASAGIKRTKKDEKKSKNHDLILANFLVKLILEKKYDTLLAKLFNSSSKGYPSNLLLGIMSLVYIDISHKVRELSEKESIEFSYKSLELVDFDDSNLHPQIKERINQWVEDIVDSVSIDYSSLLTTRLLELIKSDESIIIFISEVFSFFLKESNISISQTQAINIASFILGEVSKSLEGLEIEEV